MSTPADAVSGIEPDLRRERRDQRVRGAVLLLIAAFVAAGALGAFGVRRSTASATSPRGLEVRVTHPEVARAGLAVPLSIEVRRPGGFSAPVTVSMSTDYLQLFDENGTEPDPTSSSADATRTTWEFEAPEGEVLTVWFDLRVEPGVQWGTDGEVVVESGGDRVEVAFDTWIAP